MIDKRLMSLSGMKQILITLAGISFLQAFMIILQARYLAESITGLWQKEGLEAQWQRILFFILAFAARHLLTLLRDKILDEFSYKRGKELRKALLDKVFSLGPEAVQKSGTGNVVTMALEGIRQAENYMTLILSKMTNMMIIPWVILIYVFTLDIRSALIMLIVFPVIIIFMVILGYAAQAKADRQYENYQVLSNHFVDSLQGLETLKLLGLSKKYSHNVHTVSEDYRKATMSTLAVAITSTFALDFFTTLSIAIVALFLGLKLLAGTLMLLPALTTLILAPEFFLPLREFANDYHATLDGKNAMGAIFDILAVPSPEKQNVLTDEQSKWTTKSTLSIKHMSVHYRSHDMKTVIEKPALENIQFEWQGYGKIGIIGKSGSGKSTFVSTLGGFLAPIADTDLDIKINQTEIPHFAQTAWQKELLYIPQKPYIFQGTLAENIRFYTPAATDAAVMAAIEKAGLQDFVRILPEGLQTMIGESGRSLSGGQGQRVALARAFLDDTRKVLLFDEPTAHLDIETEISLKEAILPLLDDHLVFFATHRLHWLNEMDYILVMDEGKIVQQGTLTELSKSKTGMFAHLVAQMRGEKFDDA